ncbi:MAG: YkgJ family cysteine cluster protein [Nanoarchaeota archaeon]
MTLIKKTTKTKTIIELGKGCGALCHWSGHCCKHTSAILVGNEKKELAEDMGLSEKEFEKRYLEDTTRFNTKLKQFKQRREKGRPHGPCIMLTETNRCRIHDIKPLYCRTGNCRNEHGEAIAVWFALNHFVNTNDAESMRQWAAYLRTHPTIQGGKLEELIPDKKHLSRILTHELLY